MSFQAAEAAYRTLGESENLAALGSFLGENLASLGQVTEAWDYRLRALAALSEWPLSLRRHVALMDASRLGPGKGLPVCRPGVAAGEPAGRRGVARSVPAGGDPMGPEPDPAPAGSDTTQVRSALRAAFEHARARHPRALPRKKLLADLRLAQGEALLRLQPGRPHSPLAGRRISSESSRIPLSYS